MGGASIERHRLAPLIAPRFLAGVGVLALIALVYLLLTSTPLLEEFLPERLLEFLLLGVPAVGLLYAAYWLRTERFTPDQVWQIGVYAIGATVVAATSTGIAIAVASHPQLSGRATFFLLVSTGTEGALLGVLIGAFAVTDVLRRRGQALADETDQFHYVERVADIGYWEIQPTTDPPYPVVLSKGLRRIHDLRPDEHLDVETGLAFYHPDDRPRVEAAVERALTEGEAFDLEARLLPTDGTQRWVRTVGEPIGDAAGTVKVRGVMQDITDRKEYERQLERQNERLGEFASVVSHDLRNPLNVATGRLELAREECASEHLDAVDRAHDRMETLIDDLLTLARVGETGAETEPVSLVGTVEACWQTVDTRDASLVLEAERTIRADPGRLKQLFENLLRNAVEHGGADVTITVGDIDDPVGFYVADDGPGIPPEERHRVFESGYTTAERGTGFGLRIVKAIADAHEWTVTVTDGDAGGARFEITGVEPAE